MITGLYLLFTLALLYVAGFAVTEWLLPEQLRRYRWAVTPIVGLACWILLIGLLSQLGASTRAAAPAVLVIFACLSGYAWRRGRGRWEPAAWKRPLGIAAAGTVACAWPMLQLGTGYMSYVNRDAVNYAIVARHLQTNSYRSLPQYEPYHPAHYISRDVLLQERVGSQFFLSSVASLARQDPKHVYMPVIFALHWLAPLAVFTLAGGVGLSRGVATLAAALMAVSSISAFGYLYQLFAQAAGVPLTVLTIAAGLWAVERTDWRSAALAWLLALATISAYVEIAPFALGAPALAGLYQWRKKRVGLPRLLLLGGALPFLAVAVYTPLYAWRLAAWLFAQAGRSVANPLSAIQFPYMLIETGPPALFGLVTIPYHTWPLSFLGPAGLYGLLALAAAYFGCLAFGVWRVARQGCHLLVAGAIFCALLGTQLFRNNSGFGLLKLTMYMQFLIVVLVAAGWRGLWEGGRVRRAGAAVLASLWFGGNLLALESFAYGSLGKSRGTWVEWAGISRSRALVELHEAVLRLGPQAKLVIGIVDLLPQNWLAYTLIETPLRMLNNSGGFGPSGIIEEYLPELKLPEKFRKHAGPIELEEAFLRTRPAEKLGPETYFVLWNDSVQPQEVTGTGTWCQQAIWRNEMFCVVPAGQVKDFVLPVGAPNKGFWYLDTQHGPGTSWYAVEQHNSVMRGRNPFRWLNDEGVIAVYQPSEPVMRVAMDLIVGHGRIVRTGEMLREQLVSIHYGGEKLDEVRVRGFRRYISPPVRMPGKISVLQLKVANEVGAQERSPALWNRFIPNDYRRLNLGISNVRLLTEEQFAKLEVPAALDVAGRADWDRAALGINGVYADGWTSREAEFWLRQPEGARKLVLRGSQPGVAGGPWPARYEIAVNGEPKVRQVEASGPFTLEVAVGEARGPDPRVRIRVRTDRVFVPQAAGLGPDIRELAFQLSWVGFR